jgi:hypothetical protein
LFTGSYANKKGINGLAATGAHAADTYVLAPLLLLRQVVVA